MEDKKLEKTKFSKGASFLISKFLISCHEERCGELICKGSASHVLLFSDFQQAGKVGLCNALAKFAKKLGKKIIDEEVVLKYFGSREHEKKTLQAIKNEGALEFKTYYMLVHLMIQVEVDKIKGNKIIGKHKSGKNTVFLEAMLPFGEKVMLGQKVLCHNSLVVDVSCHTDYELERYLQKEQKKCKHYRQSVGLFDGRMVKILSGTSKLASRIIRKHTQYKEVCLGK
jgi:hypothetical protein